MTRLEEFIARYPWVPETYSEYHNVGVTLTMIDDLSEDDMKELFGEYTKTLSPTSYFHPSYNRVEDISAPPASCVIAKVWEVQKL